jgi:hypothetical protein
MQVEVEEAGEDAELSVEDQGLLAVPMLNRVE